MLNAIPVGGDLHVRDLRERHRPQRRGDHETPDLSRLAALLLRQQRHDVDCTRTLKRLTNRRTGIRRLDRIQDVRYSQSCRSQRARNQVDRNRRRTALTLELQVNDAFDLPERGGHLVRRRIQRVQVVTEDLDGHLCRLAAETLADTVPEECNDFALGPRVALENRPQGVLRSRLIDRRIRFELDVELAAVGTPGVFAQLRPAHLLLDALYIG